MRFFWGRMLGEETGFFTESKYDSPTTSCTVFSHVEAGWKHAYVSFGGNKKSMHLSSMSKVKTNPTTSLNLKSSTFLCRLRSRIGQQQHVPSKSSFSCPNNGTVVKRKGMTSHVNNSKILMVGAPLVQPATGTPENIIHVSVSMT
jgi:hypothetical protein